MSFFLTLVASDKPLSAGHIAGIERYLDGQGIGMSGPPVWLARNRAADLPILTKPDMAQMCLIREGLRTDRIDVFVSAAQGRRKKLLMADMDATIVTTETLDEMAEHAGLGKETAAITARAMNGEIDFKTAMVERVVKLKGLPESVLHDTLAQTAFSEGAELMVRVMSAGGARCVLASGGFTFFTAAIAARAGFHRHHGNILGVSDGRLDGTVAEPLLDKAAKKAIMEDHVADLQITTADAMAIGDGANDLPMLLAAGLGIGYRPKPALRQALDNQILYGDLTAALYAQGYGEKEIKGAFH